MKLPEHRVPWLGRWVTSCLFAMTTGSRRRATPLGDLRGGKPTQEPQWDLGRCQGPVSLVNLWMYLFQTVDGKRDRNLDVWLVFESLGNVWCWMSLPQWCQCEAGEAEFCRSWSSSLRCEIILVVTGNVGNVDGGTWQEKFQVICIIQKTIPLMDKLPETQLIWQAHLNIASSKEKKDTF